MTIREIGLFLAAAALSAVMTVTLLGERILLPLRRTATTTVRADLYGTYRLDHPRGHSVLKLLPDQRYEHIFAAPGERETTEAGRWIAFRDDRIALMDFSLPWWMGSKVRNTLVVEPDLGWRTIRIPIDKEFGLYWTRNQ